jgi:hypothetical protein
MRKVLSIAICAIGAVAWLLGVWILAMDNWTLGCILMACGGAGIIMGKFAMERGDSPIAAAIVELLGELFHWG